jgi:adenylate cyclase class 2
MIVLVSDRMKYEVEQKFCVADPTAVEKRALALGAKFRPAILQTDCYFAHPARDFAKTDEALRIRSVVDDNWVTYKGPKVDATTKTRRELELPIEPGEGGAARFAELLIAMGFKSVANVRKQRRLAELSWHDHDIEIALDEVAGLGHFCEIELLADEHQVDEAREALATLATRLSLSEGERRSYLEMLLAT